MKRRGGARRSRKPLWIVLGVVLVLGLILGLWRLVSPPTPEAQSQTTRFRATLSSQVLTVNLTGTLAPTRRSKLDFVTTGTVDHVGVEVGDKVRRGDLLATLDAAKQRNAVDAARADQIAAEAQLRQTRNSGSSRAQINAAQAQVDAAAARLRDAETSLADARLVAPFDGVVADVSIEVGDKVGSGIDTGSATQAPGGSLPTASTTKAAITVISRSSWQVEGTVGAADVGLLKPGQEAELTITGTTRKVSGKVDTVGIVATTSGGVATFPVTVGVEGKPKNLYAGASVDVTVTIREYTEVLTVPTAAVVTENGQTVVKQQQDGRVVSTPVKIGRIFGENTQIREGLNAGDEVLVITSTGPPASPSETPR